MRTTITVTTILAAMLIVAVVSMRRGGNDAPSIPDDAYEPVSVPTDLPSTATAQRPMLMALPAKQGEVVRLVDDGDRLIRLSIVDRRPGESERDYEARMLIVESLERFIVNAQLDGAQQRVLLIGMANLQEASRRAADVWKEEPKPTLELLSQWLHKSKSALDVRLREVLTAEQFAYWIQAGLDGSLVDLLWFARPVEVTEV